MASAAVLLIYLLVAVLDSMHYVSLRTPDNAHVEHALRVQSVLDVILKPLWVHTEKTYSAPFATALYAKETIEVNGQIRREYPRLLYGGAHLLNPEQKATDVFWRLSIATCMAIGVFGLLLSGIAAGVARSKQVGLMAGFRSVCSGGTPVAWRGLLAVTGALLLLVFAGVALAPHYHVLGTDKVGQDVLYQVLKSIRTGVLIGVLTTLVMLPLAVGLGVAAGYFGGWVDDVIQYIYITLNSIPGVLLIAASILILQAHMSVHAADYASLEARADLRLLWLCIILGMTNWTGLCRLLRGETLKLREAEFILAARVLGVGHARILLRHVIPNLMHLVLISVVLDFSGLVLAEAVLSYVNIGVDPSMNSWGNMINAARLELAREPAVWWSIAAAFFFMSLLVFAANLFADVVRDAFDPRLRGHVQQQHAETAV